jgi:hypothetical protein
MKKIYTIAFLLSVAVMGFLYYKLNANTAPETVVVSTVETTRSISIIHAYKDGEHRFIGQIRLPHSCFALNVEANHDKYDPSIISIDLTGTDKMLDETLCANIPTYYPFEIITEASQDIAIHATYNGEPLRVKLTDTSWQSSAGTYINPIK